MGLQRAAVLYPVNTATVDTGTGIDIRLLDTVEAGADDDTQTVTATHTQDNVERTFDPATAAGAVVADTNALQKKGWALRLAEDCTPDDDANCNAFLVPANHVVNLQVAVDQAGGTYASGTYAPLWKAALYRYNPATDTGVVVASTGNNSLSWNVTPVTGDLGAFKNIALTFNAAAQFPNGVELQQGEILLLQLGVRTQTIPNPTLGTATFTYTLRVDNANTNITFASSGGGIAQLCRSSSLALAVTDGFKTSAKDYDGANDYMTRGAGLTGAADGTEGTFSVWFNADTISGIKRLLNAATAVGGSTTRIGLGLNSSGRIAFLLQTSGGANVINSSSDTGQWTTGALVHLLASWSASAFQCYINDVLVTGTSGPSGAAIDYTLADWGVGGLVNGTNLFDGCLSEMLFHTSHVDLSVEANRRKFITADLKAVSLGSDGSRPLGVQPLIYIKDGQNNLGSGGAFTVVGTLADCASAPPYNASGAFSANYVKPAAYVATMVGTATKMLYVRLAAYVATMVGTATKMLYVRLNPFAAIGTGVASLTKYVRPIPGAPAFMVGVAAAQRYVRLAAKVATAVGIAGFSMFKELYRSFTATMVGQAQFSRVIIAVRAFSTTMVGVATTYIKITTDILNRISSGATTIIKKFFLNED
jgi:hypothetical protein